MSDTTQGEESTAQTKGDADVRASAQRSDTAGEGRSGKGQSDSAKSGPSRDEQPPAEESGWFSPLAHWVEAHSGSILVIYLIAYSVFGVLTVPFFPSYSSPIGDEAIYYSYAEHPWTLIGDIFEGYRPKQVMNPYNFRLFLTPFAVLFKLFGFTYIGARLIVFSYGLLMLLLTYRIAAYMVRPLWCLVAVLVLSVAPAFLFLTHGVRPEGMMALFVMVCVWLIIRHCADVPKKTYFLVGLISSSTLLIHYNGVVMSPMFMVMLVGYDLRAWTWSKVTAFIGGVAVFAVVFFFTNLLPAYETIQEFGIMPVTFVSSNKLPILSGEGPSILTRPFVFFQTYFSGACSFERQSYLVTSCLFLPMLFGLFYRSDRREWLCGAAIGLYILVQILIIPNLRFSYAFYVIPLAYLLAIVGLSKLPAGWDMKLVAAAATVGIVAAYAYYDVMTLRHYRDLYTAHAEVGEVLRDVVARHGPAETVSVMAGQELHGFLHDTRFRTFHSVIGTGDFGKALDLISPDIVVLQRRDLQRLRTYLLHDAVERRRGRKASPKELLAAADRMSLTMTKVRKLVGDALADRGYVPYDAGTITWFGSELLIFVRPDVEKTSAHSSTTPSAEISGIRRCQRDSSGCVARQVIASESGAELINCGTKAAFATRGFASCRGFAFPAPFATLPTTYRVL